MKKAMKKVVPVLLMSTLSLGVISSPIINSVSAQAESATEESAVSEESASEESTESIESSESSEEPSEETDVAAFDPLFTEESVQAPLMVQAYEDYKAIFDQLEFKDLNDPESAATTEEEIQEIFQHDTEPTVQDFGPNQTMVVYSYESDEVIEELDNAPMHVDLGFLFHEGELFASVVMPYAYMAYENNLIPEEEIVNLIESNGTPADLQMRPQSLYSFSQINFDGQMYTGALVLTGSIDSPSMDNLIFAGENAQESSVYEGEALNTHPIQLNTMNLLELVAPDFLETMNAGLESETSGTESDSTDTTTEESEPTSSQAPAEESATESESETTE